MWGKGGGKGGLLISSFIGRNFSSWSSGGRENTSIACCTLHYDGIPKQDERGVGGWHFIYYVPAMDRYMCGGR